MGCGRTAGSDGKIVAFAYGVPPQFIEGVGPQVSENIHTIEPVADAGSTAYARLQKALGRQDLDIYTCHGYDEASLAILSIAYAKEASGTAIIPSARWALRPSEPAPVLLLPF